MFNRPALNRPAHLAHATRGFTLVELMISIAIVLILMLGINFVFSTSAKTISGGMAISAASREMRGTAKVMQADFTNAVSRDEMPALIIHSETKFAFRDRADQLADQDYNSAGTAAQQLAQTATYDADGVGGNGDEVDLIAGTNDGSPPSAALMNLYNNRRHRLDRISFFTADNNYLYKRQTGDDNTYVGPQTSAEAWVSYGPLRLAGNPGGAPNGETQYWKPGANSSLNANNFFASQFPLGRRVILLKPGLAAADASLGGINFGSPANNSVRQDTAAGGPYPTAAGWQTQESRLDMYGQNIATIRTIVAGLPTGALTAWWLNDADDTADVRDYTTAAPGGIRLNYLFWAKPYINKSGFSEVSAPTLSFAQRMANQTREAALAMPIFVKGCSQFLVEFAGDFYDQGPNAGVPEPLGTVDYIFTAGAPDVRQIRWYGLPRDTDEDGINDVQLLSTAPLLLAGGGPATARFTPATSPQKFPAATPPVSGVERSATFAWGPTVSGGDPVADSIGPPPTTAAPGAGNNVRPSLIRITMQLLDANGRLTEGPRIEYVFRLK
jgi:prepilin-type N-terminal cleavage/methylation domain-containing protein